MSAQKLGGESSSEQQVEDNIVYYRPSNRLYSTPISDMGIGSAKLLATDQLIRDAHWAFIKH